MAHSQAGQRGQFRQDLENALALAVDAYRPGANDLDVVDDYDYEGLWIRYSDENIAAATGKINPLLGGLDWTGCLDWDEKSTPLGHGNFGVVFRGEWKELDNLSSSPPLIVVKVMRAQMEGDDREKAQRMKELRREVEIWQSLRHQNIVPFVGYARTLHGLPSLVSTYMPNESVRRYIQSYPTTEYRNEIMLGIAEGLNYLHTHEPKIVHGDLKADNVLLDDKLNPRLVDFGLSRMMAASTLWATTTKPTVGGSLRWMAPEMVNQDDAKASAASDIYAFGMTCYEVVTGKIPYYDKPELLIPVAKYSNEIPKIPEKVTILSDLLDFWYECWDQSPILRPNSERAVEFLTDFVNRTASSIHEGSSEGIGAEEERIENIAGIRSQEDRSSSSSDRTSSSSPSPAGPVRPRSVNQPVDHLKEGLEEPIAGPSHTYGMASNALQTPEPVVPEYVANTFFTELEWDITRSPRPFLAVSSFDPKSSAFIPPVQRCKIICQGTPWKFEIKARKRQPHITISSLLNDLHAQLLSAVDGDLYRNHRSTEKKDAIMHVYLDRANSLPSHDERMEALGQWIKRVDYFLGRTRFVSLVQNSVGGPVFNLNTDEL